MEGVREGSLPCHLFHLSTPPTPLAPVAACYLPTPSPLASCPRFFFYFRTAHPHLADPYMLLTGCMAWLLTWTVCMPATLQLHPGLHCFLVDNRNTTAASFISESHPAGGSAACHPVLPGKRPLLYPRSPGLLGSGGQAPTGLQVGNTFIVLSTYSYHSSSSVSSLSIAQGEARQ